MDRSSFNFVGSTNDLEKRLAYKAKLASKIESSKPKELPTADNTFNGVSPGGKLVHPSLGEGTLVEVDHGKNEVLIDFGAKGLVGLVISQAKSFVHAPIKEIGKGIAGKDDAFIGSEIQSRLIAPQDRPQREVDFSRITSPDFIEPKKTFAPVGSKVWHPDLGACTVFSVDESTNNLTLDTPLNGRVDMVLSQVRTKLREIDTVPDHVPVKPLVREPLAKQVTQYTSRGDVSVSIPEVFKSWGRNQQFMFLTRSQHLTTEQANDVFAVIEGKKPLFYEVTLSWVNPEMPVTLEPNEASDKPAKVKDYAIFRQEKLWHPDFGECFVASADYETNELILQTSVGQVPFVLDATVPKLSVLTASVEHAPKRLGTRVLATSETPVEDRPKVVVTLPEVFVTWKVSDQYIFLTKTSLLTPECANDVIDSVSGKLNHSDTEYEIIWSD